MASMADFCTMESWAQKRWSAQKRFKAADRPGKEKYYALPMFPYPSGALHIGHVRNYALSDVDARFQRLQGKSVLHVIGWDAFGMPAENAALESGGSPQAWTSTNIAQMKATLCRLGFSFDWDREFRTTDPAIYRFEQEMFIAFHKEGWAYQKLRRVNWCPHDQTVLANEQVSEGRCWRCDGPVVQKELRQWFLKMTDFADALLEDLDLLPDWPEEVKKMQRHWIGRSQVWRITRPWSPSTPLTFDLVNPLFWPEVTFIILDPSHPIVIEAMLQDVSLEAKVQTLKDRFQSQERTAPSFEGIQLSGHLNHPDRDHRISLWVVGSVSTEGNHVGAMACAPAHETWARAFAEAHGIAPLNLEPGSEVDREREAALWMKAHGATLVSVLQLRDWGVSRQRYWGVPIPFLEKSSGDEQRAESIDQLPVELPELKGPLVLGQNPLETDHAWRQVERAGEHWLRTTETFDTFMESSWYFLRFATAPGREEVIDKEDVAAWLPVDHYFGGIEHATMHLLYFRFFFKALKRLGWVQGKEPVKRLTCQGMVLAHAFYRNEGHQKIWLPPEEVTVQDRPEEGPWKAVDLQGRPVVHAGIYKMSKSKKNGVMPDRLIEQYGADATRLYVLFAAPPQASLVWQEQGVVGASRFLKRLLHFAAPWLEKPASDRQQQRWEMQEGHPLQERWIALVEKVAQNYSEKFLVNVAIAAMMEGFNALQAAAQAEPHRSELWLVAFRILLQLLAPVTPHTASYLWHHLFGDEIEDHLWPDLSHLQRGAGWNLVVQLHGKKIGCLPMSGLCDEATAWQAVLKDPTLNKKLEKLREGGDVRLHYVAQRLLNCTAQPLLDADDLKKGR